MPLPSIKQAAPQHRIFISYSHADHGAARELWKALEGLCHNRGDVGVFLDRHALSGGDEWQAKILQALEEADVFLVLLSADFRASEFCRETELRRMLERRHADKNVRVIGIPLHEVELEHFFAEVQGERQGLAELQCLPQAELQDGDGTRWGLKPWSLWEADRKRDFWANVVKQLPRALADRPGFATIPESQGGQEERTGRAGREDGGQGPRASYANRRSDGQFIQDAQLEIERILAECPGLKAEISKVLAERYGSQDVPPLAAMVGEDQGLDTVIGKCLRPAVLACLKGLPQESADFCLRWDAAREVLVWLCVLAVKPEWVAEVERVGADKVYFEMPVMTDLGIEILSSRYRQMKTRLDRGAGGKSDVPGSRGFVGRASARQGPMPPHCPLPASWLQQVAAVGASLLAMGWVAGTAAGVSRRR